LKLLKNTNKAIERRSRVSQLKIEKMASRIKHGKIVTKQLRKEKKAVVNECKKS